MIEELGGPGSDYDNFILAMPDDRAARYAASLAMYESVAAVIGRRSEDVDEDDDDDDAAVRCLAPYFGGTEWHGEKDANEALTLIRNVLSKPPTSALLFVSLRISEPT
jgi:hypothetical protein